MALAYSKAEDYVEKVNRRHDIHLERELRHIENARKFYLKTFRAEYKAAKEERDEIRRKAEEYRRLRVLKNPQANVSLEGVDARTKQDVFITEKGEDKSSNKSTGSLS